MMSTTVKTPKGPGRFMELTFPLLDAILLLKLVR